uniref:LysR substrate-binding domain-containing protein n=1 Tax=Tetraselmis chuii TaxID=63592 RepID=A0A7S1T2U2_9CHLO
MKQHGIKWSQLNIAMEFNSVEAIKSAVRFNLGVAFVSASSIEKELELGLVARVSIRGVRLLRTLFLVSNPSSYVSPAAKKFMVDILQMQPGSNSPTTAGVGFGGGLSLEQAGDETVRGSSSSGALAAGARQLSSHMQSPRPWERASRGAVPQHLRHQEQGLPTDGDGDREEDSNSP